MMEQGKVNGVSDELQRELQSHFDQRLMEMTVEEEKLRQNIEGGKARR